MKAMRQVLVWEVCALLVLLISCSDDKGKRTSGRSTADDVRGRLRGSFRIVTASADWTAKIWSAATAEEITTLRGHSGSRPCSEE